jgi:5-hydroxyisourate hydrolase
MVAGNPYSATRGLVVPNVYCAAMGKLTTHVLDTTGGRPAAGMRIDFAAVAPDGAQSIRTVQTSDEGRTDKPLLDSGSRRVG